MDKVIFHIDEPEKWALTLANAGNLLATYAGGTQEVAVEVLANSAAAAGYVPGGDADGEELARLAAAGIEFTACRNALRGMGIAEETLYPFVRVVPAGVRELADRQAGGYAYIKP